MRSPRDPWCEACGEPNPRAGRSRLCEDCRTARRRDLRNHAQRTRRAKPRIDPATAHLIAQLRATIDQTRHDAEIAHIAAAARGRNPTPLELRIADLAEQASDLADLIELRGLGGAGPRATGSST